MEEPRVKAGRPRIIEDPVSETFSIPRKWKEDIEAEAVNLSFRSRASLHREICEWWFHSKNDWLKYYKKKQEES